MERNLIKGTKEVGMDDSLQKRFVYKFRDFDEMREFQDEMKSKGWKTWVSHKFYPEWSYNGMVLEPEETYMQQIIETPNGTGYTQSQLIDYLHHKKPEFGNKEDIEINKAIGLLIAQTLFNFDNPTKYLSGSNRDR